MTQMTVTTRRPSYAVITLDDDGKVTPADLPSSLRAVFLDGINTLLVDVSRLQRFSSDTVAALLYARREATARGGRVVLHAPNRRSAALVARSELGRLFEVDTTSTHPSPWRHP